MKERIVKRLINRGFIDAGENTEKFLLTLPIIKLYGPLVLEDHRTGKYSYQQLANKYNLTYAQVRNIVSI